MHADVIIDVSFSPAGDLIASASRDTRVKIWGGEGDRCLSELTPYSGEHVCSVRFVGTGDEIVLVTGGPANREIKLWVPGGGGAEWQCVQKVELTSSEGPEAFFNHLHVSAAVFARHNMGNCLFHLPSLLDKACGCCFLMLQEGRKSSESVLRAGLRCDYSPWEAANWGVVLAS